MAFQDYQLAFGFNDAGSLANVEDIFSTFSGVPFLVKGRGQFDTGIERERADGHIAQTGINVFQWLIEVMSLVQWNEIQDNYTTGGAGLSGEVTVRTRLKDNTYANFNAVLQLPKSARLTIIDGVPAYRNVILIFSNAEAI